MESKVEIQLLGSPFHSCAGISESSSPSKKEFACLFLPRYRLEIWPWASEIQSSVSKHRPGPPPTPSYLPVPLLLLPGTSRIKRGLGTETFGRTMSSGEWSVWTPQRIIATQIEKLQTESIMKQELEGNLKRGEVIIAHCSYFPILSHLGNISSLKRHRGCREQGFSEVSPGLHIPASLSSVSLSHCVEKLPSYLESN